MKARYYILCVLALAATACLRDPDAPNNQPDTPTLSVDDASLTRVSMLVEGSFGADMTDITTYGVELSETLFEDGGDPQILVPQELVGGNFSIGVTGLKSNSTYYMRSFIGNGHSKLYSKTLTQKTPESSVASVSDVTLQDGFNLVATIEDDGGREVYDVGFVWGAENDVKKIRREKRVPGTLSADGKSFSMPISEVGAGTYYILAYVEDDKSGTGFSRITYQLSMRDDDEVNIEDPNFKAYLLAHHDRNKDGKISYGELKVIEFVETSTDEIRSVREIEGMPELFRVMLKGSEPRKGKLTAMPVKQNSKLRTLDCSNNNIASLDLSGNKELEYLDCSGNALTALSVANNIRLDALDVSDNQLTELDLRNNSGLRSLNISGNKFPSQDYSGMIALKELNCRNNPQMDTLYLSINQEFTLLEVGDNTTIKYVDAPEVSNYMTFTSEGETKISLSNEGGNAPVIFYSTDKTNWTQWNYSEITFSRNRPLYICGDNPDGFNSISKWSSFVSSGDRFAVSGSIMSLLDRNEELMTIPSRSEYCFLALFINCENLTAAPDLPATTLAEGCYALMFSNCTSLSVAPALPATSIPSRAYYAMFHNCTNLTTAPELPATELAYRSYAWMFEECHNLTTAPDILPATTMDEECYRGMFFRCSSLTNTPQLPALVMAKGCYMSMFYECSSLVEAPVLPATTLAEDCYRSMFWNSPGLKSASSLPATTLVEDCYSGMFSYCTSLEDAPELPATALADSCYYRMFDGCTNLDYIKCLATDISAKGCTDYWLASVASQGTFVKAAEMKDWPRGASGIPEGWELLNDDGSSDITASKYLTFTSTGTTHISLLNMGGNAPVLYYSTDHETWNEWDYSELTFSQGSPLYICGDNPNGISTSTEKYSAFRYGSMNDASYTVSGNIMSLVNKDEDVITIPSDYCFFSLFMDNPALTAAPSLPATTLAPFCYQSMFSGCKGLTSAPSLPATTMVIGCYVRMFENCESLTTAPELKATTLAKSCYERMFFGCSNLASAPALPATTLAEYCYSGMFFNDRSLLDAPELAATTLVEGCYSDMFSGCENLSYVKCLATDISATNCTDGWLYWVASSGTFVKAPNVQWTIGASGIPEGWAAVNDGDVPSGGNEGTSEEDWN